MSKNQYNHFTPQNRLDLYALLLEGTSISVISEILGFHRSTIYRELYRNSTKVGYRPDIASQQYIMRRRNKISIVERNSEIYNYVICKLQEGWSPEQIAGRMKQENKSYKISHETIYQYIYSSSGKKLKLHLYLRKKRGYRYPRVRRRRKKSYSDKLSIHSRADSVNKRIDFGHWEGDLILFRKTQANLFTLRERKSRLLVAIKNANRQSKTTSKTLLNYMKAQNSFIKTLTLDNDPAFADYNNLSKELEAKLYFCDPYKSWQKGSIENGNLLLRHPLPRGFKIDQVVQNDIDLITEKINNRPMKVLNYRTPKEVFLQEINKEGMIE